MSAIPDRKTMRMRISMLQSAMPFNAAGRLLEDHARIMRGEVKHTP
jgi:hypothetical protein